VSIQAARDLRKLYERVAEQEQAIKLMLALVDKLQERIEALERAKHGNRQRQAA
jgi:uncharacterized coiled-coil protein SlyX